MQYVRVAPWFGVNCFLSFEQYAGVPAVMAAATTLQPIDAWGGGGLGAPCCWSTGANCLGQH